MASSDWPTWWAFLAPVMMLAFMAVCMGSMRCMMRGMHGRHEPDPAEPSGRPDYARPGPHVPAHFPDGPAGFQNIGTPKDKAEFDTFMAEQKARPSPPS